MPNIPPPNVDASAFDRAVADAYTKVRLQGQTVPHYIAYEIAKQVVTDLNAATATPVALTGRDDAMTETQFIVQIAIELGIAGPMKAKDALPEAERVYRDFLKSSCIAFGDRDYDWSEDAARTLAHEGSIAYWDAPTATGTSASA